MIIPWMSDFLQDVINHPGLNLNGGLTEPPLKFNRIWVMLYVYVYTYPWPRFYAGLANPSYWNKPLAGIMY